MSKPRGIPHRRRARRGSHSLASSRSTRELAALPHGRVNVADGRRDRAAAPLEHIPYPATRIVEEIANPSYSSGREGNGERGRNGLGAKPSTANASRVGTDGQVGFGRSQVNLVTTGTSRGARSGACALHRTAQNRMLGFPHSIQAPFSNWDKVLW
jgi:hypothetical protein